MRPRHPNRRHRIATAQLGLVGLSLLLLSTSKAYSQVPANDSKPNADNVSDASGAEQQPEPQAPTMGSESSQVGAPTASHVEGTTEVVQSAHEQPTVDPALAPTALIDPNAATGTVEPQRAEPVLPPPQQPVGAVAPVVEAPSNRWSRAFDLAPRHLGNPVQRDQTNVSPSSPDNAPMLRVLGAALDVGIPDGVMAGLSVRPWSMLRAQAAIGTNAVSLGIRGGLALRLPTTISPALVVEAGHYFEGDANRVAGQVAGSTYRDSPIVEALGYRFANLHAGLEFGNTRSTFYLHGGMTYLHANLRNANAALNGSSNSADSSITVNVNSDPRLSAWIPSVKLGFLFYLV